MQIIFSRGKGLVKELIFLAFFLHLPTTITMTKTENTDFAFIFKIYVTLVNDIETDLLQKCNWFQLSEITVAVTLFCAL